MNDERTPYLCGGVFFFLLLQAVLPNGTARDHRAGIKDEHKAPIVMSDLIYVFTDSKNYGAEKDTSYYRECSSEGSCNIPFNDIAVVTTFDNTIKEKYSIALKRMTEFVNWHINYEMKTWLVKALLEVMENDVDISDTDSFYILSSGQSVELADIKKMTAFELQPFLLGVLHFILSERREQNHYGKTTLDTLGTKKARKERRYNGSAGQTILRNIEVSLYEETAEITSGSTPSTDADDTVLQQEETESDDDIIISNLSKPLQIFADAIAAQKHQMAEQIRKKQRKTKQAEVIDDTESSSAAADTPGSTKVVQQTIVNQYGDHPVNIGHVENLKL